MTTGNPCCPTNPCATTPCVTTFHGGRRGNNFAFVLVLFILLVIVGAAWWF